jgi:predicted amidohydrolase YtcJ
VSTVRLRRAEVAGRLVDVRCADGRVTDVAPSVPAADVTVDADGGALLPGLHDHHIHLFALAAARTSVDLAKALTPAGLDEAIRTAARSPDGSWLRVVGYHESVHGPLDRQRLDALAPIRSVRVQHRTGAMWVLNTPGLQQLGLDDDSTGRLYGLDDLIRDRADTQPVDLTAAGRELAACGVTGVTDLTPTEDPGVVDALAEQALAPEFPLRVTITGAPALPASAGRGLPRGPAKVVVGDHDLPTIEQLMAAYRQARASGRNVAVHCASRIALVLALAAWEAVGARPGDRIEHGAVIPLEVVPRLRELGLVVVTQPAFVSARGDQYLSDVEAADVGDLWRCGSLLDAGVGVGGSTDAPFGPANPWQAIATAVDRRTKAGTVLGAAERVDPGRALALFLSPPDDPAGAPRRVTPGASSDLCLLDRPLAAVLAAPVDARVVATLGRAGLRTFG